MKRILFCLCVSASGCLAGGCLMDASKLAGFSNPKLIVKKTWSGFYAEAGSDFSGKLDATFNPETNQFVLKGEVSSNVSGVVSAEGERADHLLELRKVETQYYLAAQQQVGKNFEAFGTMLAIASTAGGDAVAKVIDAAAPILKGSNVTLPGGISGTLGSSAVPVPGP